MHGLKSSSEKNNQLDSFNPDTTIHIKVDSDRLQKDKNVGLYLLEQMVISTYQNASVQKSINEYGLLTDVYIIFSSINDATHFKLIHNN